MNIENGADLVAISWLETVKGWHHRNYSAVPLRAQISEELWNCIFRAAGVEVGANDNPDVALRKSNARDSLKDCLNDIQTNGIVQSCDGVRKYKKSHIEFFLKLNAFNSSEPNLKLAKINSVFELFDVMINYVRVLGESNPIGDLDSGESGFTGKMAKDQLKQDKPKTPQNSIVGETDQGTQVPGAAEESENTNKSENAKTPVSSVTSNEDSEGGKASVVKEVVSTGTEAVEEQEAGESHDNGEPEYFWPENPYDPSIMSELEMKSYGKMMNLGEAAEFVGLSVSQVRVLLEGKKIRRYRNGFYPIDLIKIGIALKGFLCRAEFANTEFEYTDYYQESYTKTKCVKIGLLAGDEHFRIPDWHNEMDSESWLTYGDPHFVYGFDLFEETAGMTFYSSVPNYVSNLINILESPLNDGT